MCKDQFGKFVCSQKNRELQHAEIIMIMTDDSWITSGEKKVNSCTYFDFHAKSVC